LLRLIDLIVVPRSYFDAVQRYGQQEPGKSYTPDTTGSGRASADSPDSSCNNKSGGSNNNESQNLMLGSEASQHGHGFGSHHSHHQGSILRSSISAENFSDYQLWDIFSPHM
jgi:hypothetical protein